MFVVISGGPLILKCMGRRVLPTYREMFFLTKVNSVDKIEFCLSQKLLIYQSVGGGCLANVNSVDKMDSVWTKLTFVHRCNITVSLIGGRVEINP